MARRFIFRLQPVLDQRERDEEQAQVRVAAIERDRLALEQTLRDIQREVLDARTLLRGHLHPTGPVTTAPPGMAAVRQVANATLHLAVRAQRTALELAGVHKRLDAARADLLRAAAARKAVQLLKDRALEEHRRALLKSELAEIDELAVMRHGRDEALTMPFALGNTQR